jgi:hypothetical protein
VIPFGGAGRGRGGECFAQGGDGGGHRSWPERPGGGGDPESPVRSRGRERSARGARLGRVNDPDPSRVGLAEPKWAGLGQLASWAKKALAIYSNKNF